MEKPDMLPEWATNELYEGGPDAGMPTKLVVSAGEMADGYHRGHRPPARKLNWLLNKFGQWVKYLDHQRDEDYVTYTSQFTAANARVDNVNGRVDLLRYSVTQDKVALNKNAIRAVVAIQPGTYSDGGYLKFGELLDVYGVGGAGIVENGEAYSYSPENIGSDTYHVSLNVSYRSAPYVPYVVSLGKYQNSTLREGFMCVPNTVAMGSAHALSINSTFSMRLDDGNRLKLIVMATGGASAGDIVISPGAPVWPTWAQLSISKHNTGVPL